ncbi:MAG: hypothetical protein GY715_03070 [Planctomycetes bacterium]|nr:hypothetical protein [Planctomycetota bacterium]
MMHRARRLAWLLLLAPCACTSPEEGVRRQLAAADTDSDGRVARALDGLQRKAEKRAQRDPEALNQPHRRQELHLRQRLGAGQTEYPMDDLRDALADIRAREAAAGPGPQAGGILGWTELGPGNIGGRTRAIIFDPTNPSTMYAGGVAGGVWKSVDGGLDWSPTDDLMMNLAVSTIAIDPADTDVLYAGTGEGFFAGPSVRGLGIFKSADAGATWTQLASTVEGVPYGAFHYVNKIVISPNDTSRVYAATRFGVWRSLDAGLTWSLMLANPSYATGPFTSNGSNVGCTDLAIREDADPDVLWAAFGSQVDDGLFRSDDGGRNWGVSGYWTFYQEPVLPPFHIHPDFHEITFHPDYDGVTNQVMYVGNDGGIFRTLNARADVSQENCPLPEDAPLPDIVWENMNNGYGVTQFYHGDSARNGVDAFAGGTQDNGTNMVLSTSTPDDWDLILGGDGGYVAIDPTDHETIYAEVQFFPNFYKSVDGGETFVQVIDGITDTNGPFLAPLAMSQSNPNVLWTGSNRPWRTTSAATSWAPAGPVLSGANISAVAVDEQIGKTVYFGMQNGYVARTTNGQAGAPTWELFGSANGLPVGAWVSSVTIDPNVTNRAYATYSNFGIPHVYVTNDGGQSWTSIDGIAADGIPDIAVHWLAVRPCDSNQLYAATELGLFASDDAGQTWQPANQGFVHTVVESLDWRDDDTLVAFTHGRGAFLASLASCGSCATDLDGSGDVGFGDILQIIGAWGPCPPGVCAADLNANGDVDFADIIIVIANWGPC